MGVNPRQQDEAYADSSSPFVDQVLLNVESPLVGVNPRQQDEAHADSCSPFINDALLNVEDPSLSRQDEAHADSSPPFSKRQRRRSRKRPRPCQVFEFPKPIDNFSGFFQQTKSNRCLQTSINNLMGHQVLKNKDLPDPTRYRPHPNFPETRICGFVIDDAVSALASKGMFLRRVKWSTKGLCKFLNPNIKGKFIASGIHNKEGHSIGIDADRRLVFGWEVWPLDNPRCIHMVMNSGISHWHELGVCSDRA